MHLATMAGLAPRDLAIADPERRRRFEQIAKEAGQIVSIGFDLDGNPYFGDRTRFAEI